MCGRVVATRPRDYLAGHFDAELVVGPELPPSYNVAPGATVYAVARTRDGRAVGTMRWGFVPPWAANPDEGPRPINARAETLLDTGIFVEAVERRHTCVIPVDGFYEWEDGPEGKRPFVLAPPDGFPLALAGVWSRWAGPGGEPVTTCAIVTTEANEDVAPLHDRMPVALGPEQWPAWVDADPPAPRRLAALLQPPPAGYLVARPVSRRVNDAHNDGPELLVAD